MTVTPEQIETLARQAKERWRAEEQQRIVDAVFAQARENGWCNEVLTALEVIYPEHEGEWRSSDGFDVYGMDAEGYSRNGFNNAGFDREGYDCDGFNRDGVNREGKAREQGGKRWCTYCCQYHEG